MEPKDACPPTNIVNCFYPRVGLKVGRQRSGTVSWVLRGQSGLHNTLSPAIQFGLRPQRKKDS